MARTSVAKAKTTAVAPADLQKEMEEMRARLQAPSGDRIKIDNKMFVLPNGDKNDVMNAIIVDFVYFNAYYTSAFDPNQIVPPDCFAIHPVASEATPSPNAIDAQCDSCQACPQNQFGSAGKGKACRNSVLVALLPPDADMDTPLMLLNLSPTAIKPFSAYMSSLLRLNRPPYSVVTEFFCDPNSKYDSVRCSDPQPVDDEVLEVVRARRAEARERLMTEPDFKDQAAANEAKAASKPRGRLQPARKRAR